MTKGRKRYWCSRNLDKPLVTLDNYNSEEILTLLDSFGETVYAKKLDQEYFDLVGNENIRLNYCKIYQVEK